MTAFVINPTKFIFRISLYLYFIFLYLFLGVYWGLLCAPPWKSHVTMDIFRRLPGPRGSRLRGVRRHCAALRPLAAQQRGAGGLRGARQWGGAVPPVAGCHQGAKGRWEVGGGWWWMLSHDNPQISGFEKRMGIDMYRIIMNYLEV